MLFDPKWEKQAKTKADPFSLATLIAWLEQQPADRAYSYGCTGHCLLAQYFTAHGFTNVSMGGGAFYHGTRHQHVILPERFNDIAVASGFPRDFTFGRALKRARALQR